MKTSSSNIQKKLRIKKFFIIFD
ncbi:MAG: hypothetical protein QG635_2343, partial [Bacteroidota bacterium]|nr:hypothetical protein [Bacteroidota bacterium]